MNFVDAQLMAIQHPKTFQALSPEELADISIGDNVKVCLNEERFWNEVIHVDGDIIYATVNNDLIMPLNKQYPVGHTLEFRKDNVYAIMKAAEVNNSFRVNRTNRERNRKNYKS